jgi:hypothetical protein
MHLDIDKVWLDEHHPGLADELIAELKSSTGKSAARPISEVRFGLEWAILLRSMNMGTILKGRPVPAEPEQDLTLEGTRSWLMREVSPGSGPAVRWNIEARLGRLVRHRILPGAPVPEPIVQRQLKSRTEAAERMRTCDREMGPHDLPDGVVMIQIPGRRF